jgi:hypothetical protein
MQPAAHGSCASRSQHPHSLRRWCRSSGAVGTSAQDARRRGGPAGERPGYRVRGGRAVRVRLGTTRGRPRAGACSERARCIAGLAARARPGISGMDLGRGLPGGSPGPGFSLRAAPPAAPVRPRPAAAQAPAASTPAAQQQAPVAQRRARCMRTARSPRFDLPSPKRMPAPGRPLTLLGPDRAFWAYSSGNSMRITYGDRARCNEPGHGGELRSQDLAGAARRRRDGPASAGARGAGAGSGSAGGAAPGTQRPNRSSSRPAAAPCSAPKRTFTPRSSCSTCARARGRHPERYPETPCHTLSSTLPGLEDRQLLLHLRTAPGSPAPAAARRGPAARGRPAKGPWEQPCAYWHPSAAACRVIIHPE